jgi:hypothetical protein
MMPVMKGYERDFLPPLMTHIVASDIIVGRLSVGGRNGVNEQDDPSDERGLDDCTNDGAVDGTTLMRIIEHRRAFCS